MMRIPLSPNDLTWDFFRVISTAAVILGLGIIVVGWVVTRSPAFAATFAFGATVDIGTFVLAVRAARHRLEGDDLTTSGWVALALGGRLMVKGLLLVAAVLLANLFDFVGMVLGVLLVDTTILVFGSFSVARRLLHDPARRDTGIHGGGSVRRE